MQAPFSTWIVMHVHGDIDVTTSGQLRDDIASHVGTPRLVLDLAEVGFLDSSGVSALIEGRQATMDHGGTFAVRNPSNIVRRVLEVAGMFIEPTAGA
jgi:anti-anti-sigma factor